MTQEFVVRVPRVTSKQFNVLHFNAALKLDVGQFKNCKMEREVSLKDVKGELEEEPPEFGAGSEFGRKEREEAKRRKYERRKHKQNNSPWILKVGSGKQSRKYKGIREGGVTENTSYYVFFQAPDGAFEAFPVNEWYKFTPFQRYKALTAEEAEEKFIKRDQILNYFQLRHLSKKEGDGSTDEPKTKSERSIKKEFKVTDMDEWDPDSENDNLSENSDNEDEKPKLGKGKKKGKKDKLKKDDSDDDDDKEPGEDSDEGDNDDKEVDYMSDSSSSSESDTEKTDIKAVVDESALRDLVVSDDEEEEENKEENNGQADENKPNEEEKKVKTEGDNNSLSDSDFDSDNPDDLDVSKSALLIQNRKLVKPKATAEANSATDSKSVKLTVTPSTDENKGSSSALKFKHKMDTPATSHHNSNKKQKVESTKNELIDSIIGDVRRYLLRKPYTAFELLKMCRNKMPKGQRDKLAEIMTDVLKKLNPEKRKDHNGKLTFFLKPT